MSPIPTAFDLHVHTEYSPDALTSLEDYAQVADQLAIHVGFCDHFELAFLERQDYLNQDKLVNLFEDYDKVHSNYPHTSLSLEIDYYSNLASEVAEFCDSYRDTLDYLIGVVHTVDRLAVTDQKEMDMLVSRHNLAFILEEYFREVEAAISSQLFDGIAHIDGVMRYLPLYSDSSEFELYWQQQTQLLGRLCQKYDVKVEVNLRGLHHPWNRTHPSEHFIEEFSKMGVKFYVGSDSHSLQAFRASAPLLRRMQAFLQDRECFQLPQFRRRSS
ncbi:MAG: histidinol-phosphatase HisJ family protein [Candidatus Hodarchaeota archaeon]